MVCRIGAWCKKQGNKVQYVKVRFVGSYNYNSHTFANSLRHLQIQDCEL